MMPQDEDAAATPTVVIMQEDKRSGIAISTVAGRTVSDWRHPFHHDGITHARHNSHVPRQDRRHTQYLLPIPRI